MNLTKVPIILPTSTCYLDYAYPFVLLFQRIGYNMIKSGFIPAWVEMTAKPKTIVNEMNIKNGE